MSLRVAIERRRRGSIPRKIYRVNKVYTCIKQVLFYLYSCQTEGLRSAAKLPII